MKKIASLKLNQLSKTELERREMISLKGGNCQCGCNYSDQGGSSSGTNASSNSGSGTGETHSYGNNEHCQYPDGSWGSLV